MFLSMQRIRDLEDKTDIQRRQIKDLEEKVRHYKSSIADGDNENVSFMSSIFCPDMNVEHFPTVYPGYNLN